MDNSNNIQPASFASLSSPPSLWRAALKVGHIALGIAGSFTFSLGVFFIPILSGLLPFSSSEELVQRSAATTLIASTVNTTGVVAIAWLVILGLIVSESFGRWRVLKQRVDSGEASVEEGLQLQEEAQEICFYNKNGLLIGFLFALPSTLLLLNPNFLLVDILRQDKEIAALAGGYLRTYAVALLALGLRSSIEEFLLACRAEKAAALLGQSQLIIAIVVAYVLSVVKGLGLEGIAWGFLIEAYGAATVYSLYMACRNSLRDFEFFRHWDVNLKRDWRQIKYIIKLGFPLFLALGSDYISQLVTKSLLGRVGRTSELNTAALAADNFTGTLFFFAVLPNFATGVAASQQFKREVGANLPKHAVRYAMAGLLNIFCFITLLGVTVSLYPELLVWLIDKNMRDPQVLHFIRGFTPINSFGILFDGIGFLCYQLLCSMDDKWVPFLLTLSSMWTGVLTGTLLGFRTKMGPYGVLAGYVGGLFFRMTFLGTRCYLLLKRKFYNADNHSLEIPDQTSQAKPEVQRSRFFCCTRYEEQETLPLCDDKDSNNDSTNNSSADSKSNKEAGFSGSVTSDDDCYSDDNMQSYQCNTNT